VSTLKTIHKLYTTAEMLKITATVICCLLTSMIVCLYCSNNDAAARWRYGIIFSYKY